MLVIDDFGWFWKLLQQYSINAGVPQDTILGPTLFTLCISNFSGDFISNIAIYTVNTTFNSKRDWCSDWWQ